MKVFDLSIARDSVRKFRRKQRLAILRHAIVPVTAHVASVTALFSFYYFSSGSFAFNVASWLDWLIASFLILLIISGFISTSFQLRRSRTAVVARPLLRDILAIARVDADISVETLAGDLSWIEEEAVALRAVRKERPGLRITVYYDRNRVPQELLSLVRELEKSGIELIPYSQNIVPPIRCLVVDRMIPDSAHAYTYFRYHSEQPGTDRSKHQFEWRELNANDSMVAGAVCSLLANLCASTTHTFWVGVSGINNIGKTTFATRLRSALQEHFTVDLIPDHFRTVGNGVDLGNNIRILFKQIVDCRSNADICICDRTLIDNLCFLRMRSGQDQSLYNALAPIVAEASRMFDITIDINLPKGIKLHKTTHVSAADRMIVRNALEEFFINNDVNRLSTIIDPGNFDASIENAVSSAVEYIKRLLHSRKVADS